MIQGRCPICSKSYAIGALDELPSFPFCSDRCRLIDLARWADGRYTIAAGPAKESSDGQSAASPAADAADLPDPGEE